MTGTDGATMDATSGSVASNGFIGNWTRVQSYKQGPSASLSTFFKSGLSFTYPSNSKYSVPTANTAAATDWQSFYNLNYTARRLISSISFDSPGSYYMSFLMNSGNGSAMVGLIETLTTSSADTTPQSLLVGHTYGSQWTIQYQPANKAVWVDGTYDARGGSTTSGNVSGASWFVLAKFTTAASGNDRVQVKGFAPSDTLPANESLVSWDVDYQTPITGVMRYAAIQMEFMSAVDELRFATSYVNAVGLPEAPTIGTPTFSASALKGSSTNLQITSNSSGRARFFVDGKRIPGCLDVATAGIAPNFTATCLWKAPVRGSHSITAQFTSNDTLFTGALSPVSKLFVTNRTTLR